MVVVISAVRSSSYRTLAVPRTRTTLESRRLSLNRVCGKVHRQMDSLGNIWQKCFNFFYLRPRNRSAWWLFDSLRYMNSLTYLLIYSAKPRTIEFASNQRRMSPLGCTTSRMYTRTKLRIQRRKDNPKTHQQGSSSVNRMGRGIKIIRTL